MQILKPSRGDVVRVRQRTWRIQEIRTYDDCALITLVGVGPSHGVERQVLSPFDTIEPIPWQPSLRVVSRQRWRHACRTMLAQAAPIGGLTCAAHPRIDLLPHQLEPAMALVRGMGSRVLIADDVGLGKTIQAALALSELRARRACDRALILAPAGLRDQWIAELATRFGIEATLVDSREVRRRRADLPIGVNPWSTFVTAVASFDFVKRPDIFSSVSTCRWDMVIVDEAHNVAGDNARRAACAALASRAPHVLLLTATPHSGDPQSFLSLCEIGSHGDSLLVFRRSRADAGLASGRRVRLLRVHQSAAERRMHALLARLNAAVLDGMDHGGSDEADATWLALAVLNKRAVSSARSLQTSVERRLAAFESPAADTAWQPALPLFDQDGETASADAAPDLALRFRSPAEGRALLEQIAAAARAAAHAGETKIAAVVRLLRRVREPAVVFTEYRDTLEHLARHLGQAPAVLHGGLSRDERRAALEAFAAGRRRVLLATDAAGEGLNLHHTSRLVINLELPWNPTRLEQRIGRVDRIGQRRRVHAVHLVACDTKEADVLARLRARIARAKSAIGAADPLPRVDERAVARAVIAGDMSGVESEVKAEPPISLTSLDADARIEASRLELSRRLLTRVRLNDSAMPRPADVWLSYAGKSATRAALGRHALLIFVSVCEDGTGQPLESKLVPIAIDWKPGGGSIERARKYLRAIEAAARLSMETALSEWRADVARSAHAISSVRIARERAIASFCEIAPRGLQHGLFDRRAAREHEQLRARSTEAVAECERRVRRLEEAVAISIVSPRLVLVLAPKLAGGR